MNKFFIITLIVEVIGGIVALLADSSGLYFTFLVLPLAICTLIAWPIVALIKHMHRSIRS